MRNLVTVEMANLLIALARDSEAWAQDCNDTSEEAEQARAIAAEIKEALAEERRLAELRRRGRGCIIRKERGQDE